MIGFPDGAVLYFPKMPESFLSLHFKPGRVYIDLPGWIYGDILFCDDSSYSILPILKSSDCTE